MAKYISHLDLNRCMARAMRRAAIPAWVTEGFNPHLFLTFALPLSLGQEGLQESMDIKLPDDYDLTALPVQLNAVLPEGLSVLRAAEAIEKPAAITTADYEIALRAEKVEPQTLLAELQQFLAQEQIAVIKKSKAGDRTIDIRPYFANCMLAETENGVGMTVSLPAGSSVNINPALFTDAFAAQYVQVLRVRIVRTGIFDSKKQLFA